MRTEDFAYDLPEDLVAQEPVEPRDAARLLVATATTCTHARVRDLCAWLRPGDLLVLNRTKVFPARLFGTKASGGAVEVLLVHRAGVADDGGERWQCFIRGKVRPGSVLFLGGIQATVASCDDETGDRHLDFPAGCTVLALAEAIGHIPLPPYIRREDRAEDRSRYQTVFADSVGSVAAPTASLHLTMDLLERIAGLGVDRAFVDLAIGPGTFKPVNTDRVEDYQIHAEHATCPAETVQAIAACRARGGRVVAVGTTVVRTLETAARQEGGLSAYAGWTRLFLHPPQRPQVVDALLTNFHLPRSSLLMLVACFTGTDRLQAIYAEAIRERYRFYSYGDAMLWLPG